MPRISSPILLAALLLTGLAGGCADKGDIQTRLGLARASIDRGEYGAATLELGNLLQKHPQDTAVRLLLAEVSLASGRVKAAERQLRYARDLGASEQDFMPLLGRALLGQGKFEQLLVDARPGGDDDDIATLALTLRGMAHLGLGQLPQSESMFQSALARDENHLAARVGLARVMAAGGNQRAAEAILVDAVAEAPFSVLAHQALGAFYFDLNRYAEAERQFIDAIEVSNSLAEADEYMLARVGLIECQWRVGKRDKAILNSGDLLDSYPWHPLPKYVRALLAFDDGDYKQANEFLDSVLRILPGHRPSLQLTAAANFAQGRLGRAQMSLDDVLSDTPEDYTMIRLLADTYLRMGNPAQAVATINQTSGFGGDPAMLDLRGTANLYAGNTIDALGYLRAAVTQNGANLQLQMRLAAALLNAGLIGEADALMRGWPTDLSTQRARMMLRLARYQRADEPRRAVEYAKRRRRDDPSDLHALLALAESAELTANREQAMQWLEVARERNPNALEPRLLLANYADRRGERSKQLDLARESLALQPYNDTVLAHLGEAQLANDNVSMALATFREARRVAPDSARNAINLARALLAAGDFWGGRDLIVAAATLGADDVRGLIGGVLVEEFRRGHVTQAHELAVALQDRLRRDALGHELSGDLHMLAGEHADAATAYSRAQELGDDRVLALKAFLALQGAGAVDARSPLRQWLAENANDVRMQRVLRAADTK